MPELNFTPFPVLHSERLLLRKITPADTDQVFALRTDPVCMEFLDRPPLKDREEALGLINQMLEGIANNSSVSWVIALQEAPDTLIGTIGYWRIIPEHYRAELGYMLSPQYFNKGYMTEAIRLVNAYAFNKMKLHSIEANINPANAASEAILIKTGFVKEAHFKENYYYNGKFIDSVIYSLLNPNN